MLDLVKKLLLIFGCIAISNVVLLAANLSENDSLKVEETKTVAIYFRQGFHDLDLDYKTNRESLEKIYSQLAEIYYDSTRNFRHIQIISGTSPEGTYKLNRRLSDNRLKSLKDYIQSRLPLPDSIFYAELRGINWIDLIELVRESDMPYRDEMLDILENTPEIEIVNGEATYPRRKKMYRLAKGEPYWYMYKHFFPILRQSCGILIAEMPAPIKPLPAPEIYALTGLGNILVTSDYPKEVAFVKPDPNRVKSPYPEEDTVDLKFPVLALKTNLLSDLALIPHIGAEVYVYKSLSVSANWYYAWWKSDPVHWYWRTYGGDLALKWWFGQKSRERLFNGHHLGLYGQMSTYDFELGNKGILGDKWSWGVGVEYGYAIPLLENLNLDFTLGLGYFGGEFYKYEPVGEHYIWQSTNKRNYFGPTKLEVSLVWVIGSVNFSKAKKEVNDEN